MLLPPSLLPPLTTTISTCCDDYFFLQKNIVIVIIIPPLIFLTTTTITILLYTTSYCGGINFSTYFTAITILLSPPLAMSWIFNPFFDSQQYSWYEIKGNIFFIWLLKFQQSLFYILGIPRVVIMSMQQLSLLIIQFAKAHTLFHVTFNPIIMNLNPRPTFILSLPFIHLISITRYSLINQKTDWKSIYHILKRNTFNN